MDIHTGKAASALRSLLMRDPGAALLGLRPLLTRTGAALLLDAAVFIVIAVLGISLRTPQGQLMDDGAMTMAGLLIGFALFWYSISVADLARFRRLQRRWIAARRVMRPPQAAEPVDSRVTLWKPSAEPRTLATMSSCRPTRRGEPRPSLLLWRAGARQQQGR